MSEHSPMALPSHEQLAKLARDEPEAYEALRRALIDDFIDHAAVSQKSRLKGIQFRIDALHRLSHSALGSTIRIYEMMWSSFLSLNENWHQLGDVKNDSLLTSQCPDPPPQRGARILAFPPKQPSKRG